jgi:hypothetical protein
MDPRRKIPAMALLGLSCSQCTERGLDDPTEGLEGDWEAIEIDGKKYPIVMTENEPDGPGVEARTGWDLHIAAGHVGTLAYFQEYGLAADDDALYRTEFYSDLEIDDSDAPKIRLTMKGDLVHIHDEPYQTTVTSLTGYGSETSYDDTTDPNATDTDYASTTGALDEDELAFDEFERDLHGAAHPSRAATMILDCELKAEQLHCVRQVGAGDDGDDKLWTFARVVAED